jgi:hypothetical protein
MVGVSGQIGEGKMKTSESINELATALAQAQGEISNPSKNAKNPHFKSNYADLGGVLDTVRPIFSSVGLSVVQFPHSLENGNIAVTTRLMHSSGQWLEDVIDIPLQGNNLAQAAGSIITYLRRYSLAAVAGVHQADADAQDASGKVQSIKPITATQADTLISLADEVGADMEKFCQHLKVDAIGQLSSANFDYAKGALESKRKKEGAE